MVRSHINAQPTGLGFNDVTKRLGRPLLLSLPEASCHEVRGAAHGVGEAAAKLAAIIGHLGHGHGCDMYVIYDKYLYIYIYIYLHVYIYT